MATWIVCARSAAEMPVVTPSRASIETVNAVCRRASLRSVIGGRLSSAQRCGVSVRQMRPRPYFGHEVDLLGRRELGRHREVALVLAVLVVTDDDHLALAQVVEGGLDGRERLARLRLAVRPLIVVVQRHQNPASASFSQVSPSAGFRPATNA